MKKQQKYWKFAEKYITLIKRGKNPQIKRWKSKALEFLTHLQIFGSRGGSKAPALAGTPLW